MYSLYNYLIPELENLIVNIDPTLHLKKKYM